MAGYPATAGGGWISFLPKAPVVTAALPELLAVAPAIVTALVNSAALADTTAVAGADFVGHEEMILGTP